MTLGASCRIRQIPSKAGLAVVSEDVSCGARRVPLIGFRRAKLRTDASYRHPWEVPGALKGRSVAGTGSDECTSARTQQALVRWEDGR